jgi:hypothetical protein
MVFLTSKINVNHVFFVHVSTIPVKSLIQKEMNILFEIMLTVKIYIAVIIQKLYFYFHCKQRHS